MTVLTRLAVWLLLALGLLCAAAFGVGRTLPRAQLAITAGDDLYARLTIRLLDARHGIMVRLPTRDGDARPLAWHPRGTHLAYIAGDGNFHALHVLDMQTRADVRLYNGSADWTRPPVWHPDGTQLALGARVEDAYGYDVYVLDAATGTVVERIGGPASDQIMFWGPTGDALYTRSDGYPGGLYRYTFAPPRSDRAADGLEFALSHDGAWLAWRSTASGFPQVYVAPVSQTARPPLALEANNRTGGAQLAWAPGAPVLGYLDAFGGFTNDLWTYDVTARRAAPVTFARGAGGAPSAISAWAWGPDSRTLAYARFDTATSRYSVRVARTDGTRDRALANVQLFGGLAWRP